MLCEIIKIEIAWLVVFMSCSVVWCGRVKRVVGGSEVECVFYRRSIKHNNVLKRQNQLIKSGNIESVSFNPERTRLNYFITETPGDGTLPCAKNIYGTQLRFASLRNASSGQHLCGATLLTPEIASTAAHCASAYAEYLLQLDNHCEEPPTAKVLEVIQHELYNKYSRAHDIALLRVEPINLAGLNESVLPKYTFGLTGDCKVYGYGVENTATNAISGKLLEANVRTVSLDECTDSLGQYVAPTYDSGMMCALGNDVDACEGDSGGPLVCDGVVEGISSHGVGCAIPGVPAVYTSIRAHLAWIQSIILPKIKPV